MVSVAAAAEADPAAEAAAEAAAAEAAAAAYIAYPDPIGVEIDICLYYSMTLNASCISVPTTLCCCKQNSACTAHFSSAAASELAACFDVLDHVCKVQ